MQKKGCFILQQYIKDQLKLFHDNPVINWHEHVWTTDMWNNEDPGVLDTKRCDGLVEFAKTCGIDKLVCSVVSVNPHCTPKEQEMRNNATIEAMERHPDTIMGMAFVNPGNGKHTLQEVERCVKEYGFVGVKMYHQYFMDDPVQYDLVEKCIELDIPILMHAGKLVVGPNTQPRLSGGEHFANIARRYPEANFIMAHVTGGGDWAWQLKGIVDCPNVVTDISGSVSDTRAVEEAVRMLGVERVLWGTDGSASAGVGKLLSANLTDEEKKIILAGPKYERFLKKGVK